ncbi:hypothetical protein AMTR_s00086p00016620 [Amborella trichopoda]|uniref:Uncharacterized protein n=1 Tax=Amborella trichopoda TaxID=13333 RepID=W1P5A1_AMBTC|nr:hypothetical protein AMTR_s00086p00016620 [Amborella trichopoda]
MEEDIEGQIMIPQRINPSKVSIPWAWTLEHQSTKVLEPPRASISSSRPGQISIDFGESKRAPASSYSPKKSCNMISRRGPYSLASSVPSHVMAALREHYL